MAHLRVRPFKAASDGPFQQPLKRSPFKAWDG
jgi:hypothetical protein